MHPRNAQTLARHSTIDLTMNVYTHVDMVDLASDVESLPGMGDGSAPDAQHPNNSNAQFYEAPHEERSRIPADLASLASSWDSLPDHVRQTITTLCSA